MSDPWGKISRLSAKEIRDLQNKKIRYFINRHLYPFSPYYRKLFDEHKINPRHITRVEDLRHIPFTSKIDFIGSGTEPEKYMDFILQPDKNKIRQYWPKYKLLNLALLSAFRGSSYVSEKMGNEYRPMFITFTTGTTNKPVPFVYSDYDIRNLYASGARMISVFGMREDERVVNLFPFAPHLAFWQVVFGGFAARVLILSTGGGKVMSSEGNVAALLRMKPSVLLGVPSYIYHVLRLAKDKGYEMGFLKKIVLGAARVSDAFKVRLTNLLLSMGAKDVFVFGTYGFTEARSAWVECPTQAGISSGYHLYPDKEIFEIVDPKTGENKMEGQDGELVYTSLDSRGSVVIRYRTGDFVKGGITYEPCPYCKMTVPRISSDITRLSDVKDLKLSKIKGTLVNLDNLTSVLTEFDEIIEWQIEVRKKSNDPFEVDELVIYACVKDGVNKEDLAANMKKSILLATEVTPNEVIFLSLAEIIKRLELETASKEKRILDSRPK